MTEISNFYAVEERYDYFIFDLFGVLHNGMEKLPGALEALEHLKAQGKTICLLSNAPRRAFKTKERLEQMGIPSSAYDYLMTSGEDAHLSLLDEAEGKHIKLYHLGTNRDVNIYDDIPHITRTQKIEEADVLLNSDLLEITHNVEDYADLLKQAISHKVPMICVNPDKAVMIGNRRIVCAGALAEFYTREGGDVHYYGKPFASGYERCLNFMGNPNRCKILALGDSPNTDIQGASNQAIDSALLATGLHHKDLGLNLKTLSMDHEKAMGFVQQIKYFPSYVFPTLLP